eukprot:3431378-Prorocentrum_lima.AAC.1
MHAEFNVLVANIEMARDFHYQTILKPETSSAQFSQQWKPRKLGKYQGKEVNLFKYKKVNNKL